MTKTPSIFLKHALIYLRSGRDRNEKISNYRTANTQVDFFDLCDANKLEHHSVSEALASQSLRLVIALQHESNYSNAPTSEHHFCILYTVYQTIG